MSFILLAHGSSDARHASEVRELAENVSGLLGEEVGCAFLSDDSLTEGARVLPLFLGHGRHGSVDAPALAEKSGVILLPSLAAHADAVAELAYDRVTAETRRVKVLFGLYRFSGFEALYAALHEHNKHCTLVAHGALHGEPSVASVLDLWREDGVSPVKLQPMLLFNGKSLDEMTAQAKGEDIEILPVLSQSPGFPELISSLLECCDLNENKS
ncbi:MAG: hypothetical protein Q9M08_08515 [Mariprofundus sp.]|nr:hypothetical protein [Mariprofundus sp.]